ncbi:hypothetical protein HKX48_003023, partial [Thoreauomyces humboldtii]
METQVTKVFREQFNIPDVKVVEKSYLSKDEIAPWTQSKFTVLLAKMQGNKTGAVIDFLEAFCAESNLSVLW